MYGSITGRQLPKWSFSIHGNNSPGFPGEPFVYNNPTGSARVLYPEHLDRRSHSELDQLLPVRQAAAGADQLVSSANEYPMQPGRTRFCLARRGSAKSGQCDRIFDRWAYWPPRATILRLELPPADKLVFTAFDINSSPSTDTNFVNLNFVVFANIVVSNFPTVVNVTAATPTAPKPPRVRPACLPHA